MVFPENTKEVSQILSYCNKNKIKVVPRGAGTGLSGGALPLEDSVLLCLTKFKKETGMSLIKKKLLEQKK